MKKYATIVLIVALLAAWPLLAADPAEVKAFKKDWRAAWALAGRERVTALVAALEKASQTATVKMARVVMDATFRGKRKIKTSGMVYKAAYNTFVILGKNPDIVKEYAGCVSKEKSWRLKAVLVRVLGELERGEKTLRVLHAALFDKAWQVRAAAIASIRKLRDPSSVPVLIKALEKASAGRLRAEIEAALRSFTGKSFMDVDGWKKWFEKNKAGLRVLPESEAPSGEQPYTAGFEKKGPLSTSPMNRLYGKVTSKRVIFIVDVSKSMSIKGLWNPEAMEEEKPEPEHDAASTGVDEDEEEKEKKRKEEEKKKKKMSRLDVVKLELCRVIEYQLAPDAMFNIITFHDKVFLWKKKLIPATDANKKSACRFIKSQKADLHTNSIGALEAAFKDADVNTIYFLSDGTPTCGSTVDTNEILARISGLNTFRNVTVHALAFLVGDGAELKVVENKPAAARFMESLARQNNGKHDRFE